MICPHCGRDIGGNWQPIQSAQFHAAPWNQTAPLPAFTGSYERRAPARAPEFIGDVAVPATQSLITAGVGAIIGGAIGGWPGAAIGGGLVWSVTWFVLLGEHRRGLWIVERITNRDLDGDGVKGEPAPRQPLRVEIAQGRQVRLLDLPVSDEKLETLASAVLEDNKPFSRRGLADVLTPDEYDQVSAAMLTAGLLISRGTGKTAGVELTHAGRAMLRKFL